MLGNKLNPFALKIEAGWATGMVKLISKTRIVNDDAC